MSGRIKNWVKDDPTSTLWCHHHDWTNRVNGKEVSIRMHGEPEHRYKVEIRGKKLVLPETWVGRPPGFPSPISAHKWESSFKLTKQLASKLRRNNVD